MECPCVRAGHRWSIRVSVPDTTEPTCHPHPLYLFLFYFLFSFSPPQQTPVVASQDPNTGEVTDDRIPRARRWCRPWSTQAAAAAVAPSPEHAGGGAVPGARRHGPLELARARRRPPQASTQPVAHWSSPHLARRSAGALPFPVHSTLPRIWLAGARAASFPASARRLSRRAAMASPASTGDVLPANAQAASHVSPQTAASPMAYFPGERAGDEQRPPRRAGGRRPGSAQAASSVLPDELVAAMCSACEKNGCCV
jgi:hypothetical protein